MSNQGPYNLKDKANVSHNHDASHITSGVLASARIPNATSTTVGGVKVRLVGQVAYITTDGSNP